MIKHIFTLLFAITLLASCGGDSEVLAAPEDVPAGFETLQLSEGQAKDLNGWLAAHQPSPDPSDMAQYLKTLLRKDQQDALDKLLESAEDPNGP